MIFKDSLLILQTVFLLALSNGKAQKNRKCYVCGPKSGPGVAEVAQMFPEGPAIPPCNLFDEQEAYERECPSSANYGCLTQIEGTRMIKTCSDIDIEDCKTANKVRYCYCKGDLCNKERESLETSADDEDFGTEKTSAEEEQGSGFFSSNPEDVVFSTGQLPTESESHLLSTSTEAAVLSTTIYSTSEERETNTSSRPDEFFCHYWFFLAILFRLR